MMKMVRKVLGLALCLGVLAGVLCLSASAEEGHRHPICGATHKDIGDHTGTCGNVAWTPWDGTSEITYNADNIAYVYLTGNVTRNEVAYSLDIEKDHTLYLCLNGNTITAEHGGSVIDIEGTNSTLVLSDCIGSGALTHGKEQSGGVRVGKDCVFIMYGGTISGNNGYDAGGVYVYYSTFKMYGGTISGNKVGTTGPGGGGVYVNNGRFEMYDGTIRNNEAGYNGGGVYVNGRFIMHDGMITDNTAAATSTNNSHPGGGGVYVSGTFEMKGGTISGNTATANGGGVYVRYSGTFEVSGDISISGNTASVGNGVFLVNSASLDSYITIADRLGDTVSIEVTTRMAPTSDRTAPVKIATATKDKSAFADLSKFTYTNKTADGEDILPFKIPKIGGVDIVACVHNYNGAPWQADENDHWHNCLICGSKDTPASHNYNKKDTGADYLASAATCTAPATYYYSCECGAVGTETFEDGVTNPDMHSGTLSEWQSDEDNHWKEYLCCHTESNRGKHSWNNGTVTKEATCTTAGEKTFTCNVCGKIKTEKINATGHDWATEWSHDGTSHWYECENGCGEKGQKAEHTFSEWSDGKRSCTECSYEETCTHSGGTATCTAKAVCKTCGEAYGGLDPTNHSGEKVWDTDANNHTQKWNCCNTVVVASEPHEWGTPTITPATCTTAGNKHYICDVCSAEKDETIPATGHTKGAAVKEKETAVTCTVDGSYDEVVYCTVCNAELSRDKKTIPALGHDFKNGSYVHDNDNHWKKCARCDTVDEESKLPHVWDSGKVTTEPTCTTAGEKTYTCSVCKREKTEVIQAQGHDYSEPLNTAVAPTCTTDGKKTDMKCSRCDAVEIGETLNALGHDTVSHEAKAATCTEIGWGAYDTCSRCDYTTYKEIPATGHADGDPVTENRVEPTCTAAGSYDEVVYCKTCNAELSRMPKTLNALGHDLVHHEAKAATCTEIGWGAYDTCSRCDYSTYNEIPATGHTDGEPVTENKVDATCTVDGSYDEVVYCTVCNAELSRTPRTIDALGHTWVDATCTEPKTCSVCSATEGSAMGHDWGDWTVITAATEDAEGTERRVCRNDGSHRQTRAIPKLAPADCSMGDDCPLCGFRDLKTDDWYHDGVHYCLEKGLMKGFADGLFQPGGDTTRAQLAMILWRLEGSPAVETAPEFDDVDPDAWYIGAVRWASAEGVVLGFGDGRFAPDEAVTREQMAAILWRYAARLSRDVSADGDLSGFADAASVSAYAVPALEWARATGLVEGIEQGGALRLAPGDPTTRAQMATLLLRFLTAA